MKIKSLILLLVSLFVLFSCDSGLKFDNPLDRNSDAYNPSDTEPDNDSGETDTVSEYDDDKTDTASTNDDENQNRDDSDSTNPTHDDADSVNDSGDSVPDESDSDDDSADSVSDDDSDSTDPTPDESDSTPDEDADTDSGDSTPDQDTDTDTAPTTPCDPNPCSSVANSTGACNVSGTSYSCGCNSGYFWNGTQCKIMPECSVSSGTPCKDSTSGLTWSKKAENTMAWQDAKNYCNNHTEGGFSWHLPNIDELRTIFIADRASACQLSETNNCVSMSNCWSCETCMETGIASTSGNTCSNWGTSYSDGRYSKFGETGWFWSSSTQSASSNNAFGISFNVGGISDYARSYDHDVRCVRCEDGYFWNGSTCAVLPECSKTSGTPCKDSTSKLTWSKKSTDTMKYNIAKTYCSGSEMQGYGGFYDWRLPTISELRTLIQNCSSTETGGSCGVTDSCLSYNECRNDACLGCSSDPNGKYSKFEDIGWIWSSSIASDDINNAWRIYFNEGRVDRSPNAVDGNYYVRCVR